MTKYTMCCICLFVCATAATKAGACEDADLALGEYLAAECTGCHQIKGQAQGMPRITGWPAIAMVGALRQYKSGFRDNRAMRSVAQSLNEEEMCAVAKYFEQVAKRGEKR